MKFAPSSKLARLGTASVITLALTTSMATPANAAPLGARPATTTAIAHSAGAQSATGLDAEARETRIAWATILTAVIAAGGAADYMGSQAAQRMYYAGLRFAEYQEIKWSMRAMVIGAIGPIFGSVFLLAFENKFYSLV
ncbi:hypothetical protein SAMN06295974_2054 [Plantibacter flavus]|uniref:Uncharacterized protein n=1 Tax=Plantibacter flavus TaxID=150123 RepID=A0A3N2BZW9_9MICO|nr:hypothetical protein [Plantibacter flavus]ROR80781.1 hypothetical protein EDD42_0824 [Plantibacter flavus]SMG31316.1 hypothetical protein SAMN06295974_2054 [Plantibacter flavus]